MWQLTWFLSFLLFFHLFSSVSLSLDLYLSIYIRNCELSMCVVVWFFFAVCNVVLKMLINSKKKQQRPLSSHWKLYFILYRYRIGFYNWWISLLNRCLGKWYRLKLLFYFPSNWSYPIFYCWPLLLLILFHFYSLHFNFLRFFFSCSVCFNANTNMLFLIIWNNFDTQSLFLITFTILLSFFFFSQMSRMPISFLYGIVDRYTGNY